jgi:hypothetical protein
MQPAHLHSAHLAAAVGSRSSGGGVVAVVAIACLVAFVFSLMWTARPVNHGDNDGLDGESGSEGGGGPGGGGGPDRPSPDLDDPVWWPEFEREFADYVASTTRG